MRWLCGAGIGVICLLLLPQVLATNPFGPLVTVAEAKQMPEFLPGGRTVLFIPDTWRFWMAGNRTGLRLALTPPLLGAGLLLPLLIWRRSPEGHSSTGHRFPLVAAITDAVNILWQLCLSSVGLFLLAHALLFKLYLPSRYTVHSLRMILAIAAGVVLTLFLDAVWGWAATRSGAGTLTPRRQILALGLATVLGMLLVLFPLVWGRGFPNVGYVTGTAPEVYEFFAQQPRDTLVASISSEANNLPGFTQRSTLVGQEYAIPYHLGYYHPLRQRILDTIRAQYSPSLSVLQGFIHQYGVDWWLLDKAAFQVPYFAQEPWLQQFQPFTQDAKTLLEQGKVPALAEAMERCTVLDSEQFTVVRADCLSRLGSESSF